MSPSILRTRGSINARLRKGQGKGGEEKEGNRAVSELEGWRGWQGWRETGRRGRQGK